MSRYKIAVYPQAQYRFRLYDNTKMLDWPEIQRQTGAYALVNLGYFDLSSFEHQCAIMVGGKWAHPVRWHEYGMLIDQGGHLTLGTEDQAVCDYIIGCPTVDVEGRRYNTSAGGRNGWTYTGLKADGTVVALLCPKDTPMETGELDKVMRDAGCVTIWRWDGSWSSRGTLGPGLDVTPSQYRACRSWLLIYKKEGGAETPPEQEDKPMVKHTVCLDPGHGPGNVNGSPDGTYKEWEFTWDMAQRVKPLLEAQGVGVVLTKTADNYPSLTERANISNKAKPDCFVSIHTNAGQGKGWSSGSGLEIYTSAGPMTAQRNVLASRLVNAFHAAGVALRSEPIKHNIELTVLAKTDAPAALIEYGFHTNKTDVEYLKDTKYRDRLADATAKGICEFLGVAWQAEPDEDDAEDTPDSWAAEAWEKARDKGVLDGTRPRDNMTRQELAVVLERLNLLS